MQKMKQYNMTISAIQDDKFHNTDFPKPDFPTEHGMQKMKQYNMTISAIQDDNIHNTDFPKPDFPTEHMECKR